MMTTNIFTSILQQLVAWDTRVTLAINSLHSPFWDSFMYMFSDKWVWLLFYGSFVFVVCRFYRWSVGAKFFLVALLLLVIDDQVCATVLRRLCCRLRPSNLDNPISAMIHIVAGHRGGRYGFPSAHACNTFGLAFFLCYTFRRHAIISTSLIWAMLTCYSRIYLGVHYFGDCLAGAILGLVNASIVYYVFQHVLWKTATMLKPHPGIYDPPVYIPVIVCWSEILVLLLLSPSVMPR